VPLTSLLLRGFHDLQEIDDFVRKGERFTDPEWPWASEAAYRVRLEEARREWAGREPAAVGSPACKTPA
jgi:hypothetical protein